MNFLAFAFRPRPFVPFSKPIFFFHIFRSCQLLIYLPIERKKTATTTIARSKMSTSQEVLVPMVEAGLYPCLYSNAVVALLSKLPPLISILSYPLTHPIEIPNRFRSNYTRMDSLSTTNLLPHEMQVASRKQCICRFPKDMFHKKWKGLFSH